MLVIHHETCCAFQMRRDACSACILSLRGIGNLIRRAQQLHRATWARVADPQITSTQYSILVVLERLGEASQRELGDEIDLDRSTIADLVRRMEKAGLIERRRAEGGAWRNVVTLTEHGAVERNDWRPWWSRCSASWQGTWNQPRPRRCSVDCGRCSSGNLHGTIRIRLRDAVGATRTVCGR